MHNLNEYLVKPFNVLSFVILVGVVQESLLASAQQQPASELPLFQFMRQSVGLVMESP